MSLDAIRRRDPAFDTTRFLARAEAVLALVMRARAEGRPDQARAVVSDDMALRLQTELEGQRAAGRRHVHQGVRVRSAEIAEVASDDRWDTVAVRFALEGAAYEAEAEGDAVAGADRGRRRWAEVWWFQRQAGATTSRDDDALIFDVQAVDDPKGEDSWVWKGGTVTGPEQGASGVDPGKLYPLAGLDLSNLARLCDAALGATGIPDGVIESPYLLKINRGLTWYIPVQSESRSSNRKTYWAAPDGSKPHVF